MKYIFSLVFLALVFFLPINGFSQININTSLTDNELVQRLTGQGVRVSNIQINCPSGKSKSYGAFTDNTGTLGLSDGLIMTTGAANNAKGPNNSASKSQDNGNGNSYDNNLQSLVPFGDELRDICTISFDIEVFSDTLVFNYVFGSEEYLEFVKDYHDVFGFFISGPGISGQKNIAVVPNTQDPVSVANINNDVNAQYYISNGTGGTPFINLHVQYDGFTRRLQSRVAVIPCQTYHLKMAIADVKDSEYDSGIFLEGKSLSSNSPKVTVNYPFKRFGYGIEGCYNGEFVFSRTSRINESLTLFYNITGTAINGVDYGLIGNSITIPAGSKTATLPITAFADGIEEGIENIKIELINNCPNLPPPSSAIMTIREKYDYQAEDAQVCRGDSVVLQPNALGQYRFRWTTPEGMPAQYLSCYDCASPKASPPQDIDYKLTIIDTLTGCVTYDTVHLAVAVRPVADFSYGYNDEYTAMDIAFTNLSLNANTYHWDFGDGQTSSETNPIHFFQLPDDAPEKEYLVRLTAFRQNPSCSDQDSSTVIKLVKQSFILPNVITLKNHDGKNDQLKFVGIKNGVWSVEIYNRWGRQVYKSNAYNNDWTAEFESAGVYFYLLQNPRKDRKFKGWLEVMK